MESKGPFFTQLFEFLKLNHEVEDHEAVKQLVYKGVEFRGMNSWILVFAILLASVGLNMNSTAVIIGAMLISPLMGPINGIGFSVATYDFQLLRKSMRNFGYAVSTALVTSFIYFSLTPITTEHSELLSRTSPTIYDVLIATFGGLAGVVAMTSNNTNKGNVISGVAIATALMPPLCTAGYGLAVWNWSFFLGAIYLFVINSVFIALSAMIVTQLLKFPKAANLLSKQIKNKNIVIGLVIAVTVLPSIYLGYTLVKKEEFNQKALHFVDKISFWEGNYLLKHEIEPESRTIELVFGGENFDDRSKDRLSEKATDMGITDLNLKVRQGLRTNDESLDGLSSGEVNQLKRKVNQLGQLVYDKERELDSVRKIPLLGENLFKEIKALYPEIHSCTYSRAFKYADSTKIGFPVQLIVFETDSLIERNERLKIRKWLESRLPGDPIEIRY